MCGSQPNAGYVVLKDLNGPLQYLLCQRIVLTVLKVLC